MLRIKKKLSSDEDEEDDEDEARQLNHLLDDDEIDENPEAAGTGTNKVKDDEFDDYLVNKTTWDKLSDKDFSSVELAAELMVHRYVELSIISSLLLFLLFIIHFF